MVSGTTRNLGLYGCLANETSQKFLWSQEIGLKVSLVWSQEGVGFLNVIDHQLFLTFKFVAIGKKGVSLTVNTFIFVENDSCVNTSCVIFQNLILFTIRVGNITCADWWNGSVP